MPLPRPNDGESKAEWIDRCMSHDTMVADFEDTDQRLAICQSIWEDSRSRIMAKNEKIARRTLPMAMAEVRVKQSDSGPKIVGYASVFYNGTPGTEFRLGKDLVERIMPGTFDKTLRDKDDVTATFNHDPNLVLGRTSAGTLVLSKDKRGLRFEVTPGNTQAARDLLESIGRRDITGSSFGFETIPGTTSYKYEGGIEFREIRAVKLLDVGPGTWPAYADTDAGVRDEELAEIRTQAAEWPKRMEEQQKLLERAKKTALTHQRRKLQSGKSF